MTKLLDRVWEEFEELERMRHVRHRSRLEKYEARVGAEVETDAGELDGEAIRFSARVVVVDPPHEITLEQDWVGHGWKGPLLITIRLTSLDGRTLVELFHHGFEVLGADAAENHRGFEGGWTMRQLEALRELVRA